MTIKQAYRSTSNRVLRERLFTENKSIYLRLSQICEIAKVLKNRTNESISFSSLLVEKCKRTFAQKSIERNLFFL